MLLKVHLFKSRRSYQIPLSGCCFCSTVGTIGIRQLLLRMYSVPWMFLMTDCVEGFPESIQYALASLVIFRCTLREYLGKCSGQVQIVDDSLKAGLGVHNIPRFLSDLCPIQLCSGTFLCNLSCHLLSLYVLTSSVLLTKWVQTTSQAVRRTYLACLYAPC